MISAFPEGPIGDGALGELRRHGVDIASVRRPTGRMGLYYHLPGGPMRPAEAVYDRAGSAFAAMRPDEWDWDRLLEGIGWLHVSGVTPALGPDSADATLEAGTRTAEHTSELQYLMSTSYAVFILQKQNATKSYMKT